MKTIIAAILGLAIMNSSVVFAADSVSHSKLSAFQNVNTTPNSQKLIPLEGIESDPVSIEEAEKLSGEFIPLLVAIQIGLIARGAVSACTMSLSCLNKINKGVNKYCSKHRC